MYLSIHVFIYSYSYSFVKQRVKSTTKYFVFNSYMYSFIKRKKISVCKQLNRELKTYQTYACHSHWLHYWPGSSQPPNVHPWQHSSMESPLEIET